MALLIFLFNEAIFEFRCSFSEFLKEVGVAAYS
jgi:hypothetical protein